MGDERKVSEGLQRNETENFVQACEDIATVVHSTINHYAGVSFSVEDVGLLYRVGLQTDVCF